MIGSGAMNGRVIAIGSGGATLGTGATGNGVMTGRSSAMDGEATSGLGSARTGVGVTIGGGAMIGKDTAIGSGGAITIKTETIGGGAMIGNTSAGTGAVSCLISYSEKNVSLMHAYEGHSW
jgi:hypothetical protein